MKTYKCHKCGCNNAHKNKRDSGYVRIECWDCGWWIWFRDYGRQDTIIMKGETIC